GRYESLDFWRGVACLSVILYHSVLLRASLGQTSPTYASWAIAGLDRLWVGVPIFFVISGYCIAAALDRASRTTSSASDFFFRRFRRIYPPLWAVIVASVLFFLIVDVLIAPGLLSSEPWAQLRPWWYSPSQWFGNLTLTETWRSYIFGARRAHFPGQA